MLYLERAPPKVRTAHQALQQQQPMLAQKPLPSMQALQPLNAREQLPGYGAQDGKNMGTGRMRHGEFEAINAKIQVKTALPFM